MIDRKIALLRAKIFRLIGLVGAIASAVIYISEPSFLTPDKILVFGLFVGMFFGQAWQVLGRLGPFVLLLFVYESFRGFADGLNMRVNFDFMVDADKTIFFGHLPTRVLQNWWWNGSVQYYDFIFYLAYMLHFVLPLVLAVYIWKKREKIYWRFVTAYVSVSFAGFLTFLTFPAAPPWMASDMGKIEPIHRISSDVFAALGIQDFPSLYSEISPNAVAAMPSLHAAYATLFLLFMLKIFKSRWRYLALIYPLLIWVGTVYQGEHYAIDEIAGIIYGVVGFSAAPYILRQIKRIRLPKKLSKRAKAFSKKMVKPREKH